MKRSVLTILIILSALKSENLAAEPKKKINHHLLNQALFSYIYDENGWGCDESRSGQGSTLRRTRKIRQELPKLLTKLDAKILIDAACGDFNWMKEVDLSMLDLYIGLDVVPQAIEDNIKKYGSRKRLFFTVDLTAFPLPKVDVILCRDCIQHLTDENIFSLIRNIKKSNSTYVLFSNQPDVTRNKNFTGKLVFQPLRISFRNLMKPPFNFSAPLISIEEDFDDKTLCLWKVEDLPDF